MCHFAQIVKNAMIVFRNVNIVKLSKMSSKNGLVIALVKKKDTSSSHYCYYIFRRLYSPLYFICSKFEVWTIDLEKNPPKKCKQMLKIGI